LAVPLIEKLKAGDKPFFLFLHYWDPHTPYLPPAEYRTMFYEEGRDPYDVNNHSMDPAWNDEMFKWYFHEWMPGVTDAEYVNALYDGETRYMDDQLQRVLAALESVKEDTLVVFTADHGEILNEQLGFYDHHGLYEGRRSCAAHHVSSRARFRRASAFRALCKTPISCQRFWKWPD
jgi:arylsulfatase A-like enzyme